MARKEQKIITNKGSRRSVRLEVEKLLAEGWEITSNMPNKVVLQRKAQPVKRSADKAPAKEPTSKK